MHDSIQPATAAPGRIALALLATLALLLTAFGSAVVAPANVLASVDHCPNHDAEEEAGNKTVADAGDVSEQDVSITWSGDPGTVTLTNNNSTDATVVFCAKGGAGFDDGSQTSGEIVVTLGPGETETYDFGTEISYFILYSVMVESDGAADAAVKPILECVVTNGDNDYTARFSYLNENDETVTIEIGDANKITGGGLSGVDQGQPTDFLPGRNSAEYDVGAFSVDFDGTNLVWTLKGPDGSTRTSTASSNSKACPEGEEPGGDINDVSPILECVVMNGDNDYVAWFGYNNPTDETIDEPIGADNKFTPAPEDRGQPTSFLPGRTPFYPNAEFSVAFDGSNLVWKLGDSTATASANSQLCPEGEEPAEEGTIEIVKFFCATEGEDAIFVFGPLFEEPIQAQGVDDDLLPDDEGCTLGADSDGVGATFVVTGDDDFEWMVTTTADAIVEEDLPVGEYTITELGTGLTAELTIGLDGDTAVVVFNYEELEADEGLIKIIKFYCEGTADDVVFTIAQGQDIPVADVETPSSATNCAPDDASFTLNDGVADSVVFTIGEDGARLIPVEAGSYTLTEVLPYQATSEEFAVSADSTTTIIVFNLEASAPGDDGEDDGVAPDQGGQDDDGVNEGVLGGAGGPGSGSLPDTSTSGLTSSLAASLAALVMLAGLGLMGHRAAVEMRRRR